MKPRLGVKYIQTDGGLTTEGYQLLDAMAVPASGGAWGTITGVLSAQLDLATALNGKQPLAAVLTATTASFTLADETKLDAITGTNTGDQTTIAGITGTKAQFDTAVTDGDIQYVGDAPTAHTHLLAAGATDVTVTAANLNILDDGLNTALHFHDADRARGVHTGTQLAATISDFTEAAQDAAGAMVDASLTYVDATPLLQRAALTGAITAAAGSNATVLGSFTTAALNTALSDNDIATGGGTATGANTGDQTITLTGDVTGTGTGSFAATIAADAVTNAKLANMLTATIKGRTTAGTGDPEDLTAAQATALLDTFTAALKGLSPPSGGGTTNFLRADGTWAAPPAGGAGTTGLATVTVPNFRFEWSETVAAAGVTAGQRIIVSIAAHTDADENSADMLDMNGMSGTAGTAQITFDMAFREPTSGPIKLNWSAA